VIAWVTQIELVILIVWVGWIELGNGNACAYDEE